MWETAVQWLFEPGRQELFLCITSALVIGLIIGGWIQHTREEKAKSKASKGDEAFFKGVQYILSNDQDQAIEEFTKSVRVNSDTIETYVALGNLFRSRGDIDRAIRIRQSIILRPNIEEQIRLKALFDLGVDYRKGGFLNRALNTFLKVTQKIPSDVETLKEIERIYEELKDWENAYRTRQKIAQIVKGDHRHILAHHLVEMGKVQLESKAPAEAQSLFNRAVSTHKECIDAYLHLGDLYFGKQEYKKAISTWKRVVEVAPWFTFLAYRRLEGAYAKMENLKPVEDFLKGCARANSDAFTHMALARYLYNENDIEGALRELENALKLAPFFWEARRFKGEILLNHGKNSDALTDYRDLIDHLNMPYLRFQCRQCGFEPRELHWQCPQCKKWDTIQLLDSSGFQSVSAVKSGHALPGSMKGK
ncbi:MAG: tetratricopeptide repeat protein [Thermodesulfobacteriota bacterium]|nr:tetratricopeptide repeat protein [Thermodesulfobacteriota bacterium]